MKKRPIFIFALVLYSFTLGGELELPDIGDSESDGDGVIPGPGYVAEAAGAERKPDKVEFSNGDSIQGDFIALEPGGKLIFSTPEALEPIVFRLNNIRRLSLSGKYIPKDSDNVLVYLTNGDALPGRLLKYDREKLLLSTSYAGDLSIRSQMVKEIAPSLSGSGSVVYEGPVSTEEWNVTNKNNDSKYLVKNKTLYMRGYMMLGQDLGLPDRARIDFDLSMMSNRNIQIYIYTDKVKHYRVDGYSFNIQNSYIYLQRLMESGGSSSAGQVQVQQLHEKPRCSYTILVDRDKKTLAMIIDGKLVKEWTEKTFSYGGTFLSFYNQGGTVSVRNLRVSKWNGRMPKPTGSGDQEEEGDIIIFSNDDQVTGTLVAIEDDQARFKTDFATLDVPIERIRSIRTSGKEQRMPRRNAGDVKAYFNESEHITINIKGIRDSKLTGTGEHFGEGEFSLSAFHKILFNIYDEDFKSEDEFGDIFEGARLSPGP